MEDSFIIKGGKALKGDVTLSGAKNLSLKALIAALMFDGDVVLENMPSINDVHEVMHLITILGGSASFGDGNTVTVRGGSLKSNRVDMLHGSKIRVSFMMFAPLLHAFKECDVPNPGGCRLGARPIDRIVDGMKALGVQVSYDSKTGYYHASLGEKLEGEYTFVKPTHTGTELLIMLSVLGTGTTVINNAALEPEIDELVEFLNQSGAKIRREGSVITVKGVKSLRQEKPFRIMSDRNEAITFAVIGIATKGDVTVHGISESLIASFLDHVRKTGAIVEKKGADSFRFAYNGPLKPVDVTTDTHPGFMTDWQPNWAVLMTAANGESVIHERMFENRFAYVSELNKLGARIVYTNVAVEDPQQFYQFNYDAKKSYRQAIRISGGHSLHNGVLRISDLRAGASLAIGALMAPGESVVHGASMLERGYEHFAEKVRALGGTIQQL